MKSECFQMLRRFFLFTALIIFIAGCGSGGSGNSGGSSSPVSDNGSASSTTSIDKGAIAVKLVWKSLAKTTDKVLYALPPDVINVKIIVSGPGISPPIESPLIDVTAGTGTLSGIPAGVNRTVTVQGLNASGTVVLYQGTKSNITINAGQTTDAGIITMVDVLPPVTTATPSSGGVNAGQVVTLTANEAATIFYTTNGSDPSTPGSPSGPHTGVDITISAPTTLQFFAVDTAGNKETVKSATYTINLGSLTVTF
jgi:hypothetical protein